MLEDFGSRIEKLYLPVDKNLYVIPIGSRFYSPTTEILNKIAEDMELSDLTICPFKNGFLATFTDKDGNMIIFKYKKVWLNIGPIRVTGIELKKNVEIFEASSGASYKLNIRDILEKYSKTLGDFIENIADAYEKEVEKKTSFYIV